jgi:hypothetical protein
VTFDRGYLREPLAEYGVQVLDPDQLLSAAFDEQPSAFLAVLRAQAEVWAGGRPLDQLLNAIERAGAAKLAHLARASLGD